MQAMNLKIETIMRIDNLMHQIESFEIWYLVLFKFGVNKT